LFDFVGLYNTKPKRAMFAMMAIIPNLGRFPGRRLRFAINPVIRLRPDGPVYLDSFPNTFMAVRLRPLVAAAAFHFLVWPVLDCHWIV
jgi:hypothetical protein